MISGHGNNLYHFDKQAIKADFSSNIAFNNKSPRIMEHLKEQLELIQNYPDPETRELRELLAQHHGVSAEHILVTNGSAEAFYLIAHYLAHQAKGAAQSLILTPSFAEYEDSCRLHQHQLHYRDIRELEHVNLSPYHSLWLGYPNNPDGYRISKKVLQEQMGKAPKCHVVLDCAYQELCEKDEQGEKLLQLAPQLIITHSLTKSFGIPGIRLGYILANAPTIASLEEMRPPWSVNALSLSAGQYILENYADLLFHHEQLMEQSQYLQKAISAMEGLEIEPSTCNFFLCRVTDGRDASALQEYLIEKHGMLIRHAGNFRGLSPQHFRLAAQSPQKNQALIQALQEWTHLAP